MGENTATYTAFIGAFAVLGWVAYGTFAPQAALLLAAYGESAPYAILYALAFAVLAAVALHAHGLRKELDEMHGMMVGMTLGMLSGLLTATLFLIPTGNFLWGVIIGSSVGLLFGVPLGRLGGHLGLVEGIVAGPMGGMMGAMLGQMVRPFSIKIFAPFFMFIYLVTLAGVFHAVNRRASRKTKGARNNFVLHWTAASAIILAASIALPFSVGAVQGNAPHASGEVKLPPYLQDISEEERTEAVVKGGIQEVDLSITASKYSPNVIVAKKGIPLRINVHADENAGCAREIVFPELNVDRIIPAGGSDTVDINPSNEGTFEFRCPMDMIRGKLIIVG